MILLLIRYLRFWKLRRSIEERHISKLQMDCFNFPFDPPIYQNEHHLSIVKMYCLAYMNAKAWKHLHLHDLLKIRSLKNLYNTKQFKQLKQLCWDKAGERKDKFLTINEIIFDLPYHDRHQVTPVKGNNQVVRNRFLNKAKIIFSKHLTTVNAYADLVWPKTKFVMNFELNHCDALRIEPSLCRDFEVFRQQNSNITWPKTSNNNTSMKFGWVVFHFGFDSTIHITEIQAPVEMLIKLSPNYQQRFFSPGDWTSFMLQQFLQWAILRGFTRFTIPTVEKRKSHVETGVVFENNYRDLPKSFGFEKRPDGWWWLDFNL